MNVRVFPCDYPLHERKNMQKYSHKSSLQYLVKVLPSYPLQIMQHNGATHFFLNHSFMTWYGRRDLRGLSAWSPVEGISK